MTPRLIQPLFSGALAEARTDNSLYNLVRAYDCIWTMLHKPNDIDKAAREANARANLQVLGYLIETSLGQEVFQSDPNQLTFPDEIIDPETNRFGLD